MADIEKKTKRYPTDLTDAEWDRITTFLALMIDRECVGRELEARRDRGCELDAQRFGARDRLLRIEMSAGVILIITYLHIRRSAGQAALCLGRID
jgi:hypothetical protein